MLKNLVDVGATATEHAGKRDNSESLPLYFLAYEVADVRWLHKLLSVTCVCTFPVIILCSYHKIPDLYHFRGELYSIQV